MISTPSVLTKARKYINAGLGGIFGFILSPVYSILEASISLVYFCILSPFLLLRHFAAKYTNRRNEKQSILRALVSTVIISPLGAAFKSLGLIWQALQTLGAFIIHFFSNPFTKFKLGLQRGFFDAINPFASFLLAQDHPLYKNIAHLKEQILSLKAQQNLSSEEKQELKELTRSLHAQNKMIHLSTWTKLRLITQAAFSLVSPKIINLGHQSTLAIRSNAIRHFINTYRMTLKHVWGIATTQTLETTQTAEYFKYLANTQTPLNLLSETELQQLNLINNATIQSNLEKYHKLIKSMQCPLSLKNISTPDMRAITLMTITNTTDNANTVTCYKTYHEADLLNWIDQSHELRLPDGLSLAFIQLENHQQSQSSHYILKGTNIDTISILIHKGFPHAKYNELSLLIDDLSAQLPRHSSTAEISRLQSHFNSTAQIYPDKQSISVSLSEYHAESPSPQTHSPSINSTPLFCAQKATTTELDSIENMKSLDSQNEEDSKLLRYGY